MSGEILVALPGGRQVRLTSPLVSTSETETRRWGRHVGALLPPGTVVGLVGPLGAGKTVLAGALFEGAGLDPEVRVTSPTFTLVSRYPGDREWLHVDLYRLHGPEEAHHAGIEDILLGPGDGLVVVEWFDRFPEIWPEVYLRVDIRVQGPETRRIEVASSP